MLVRMHIPSAGYGGKEQLRMCRTRVIAGFSGGSFKDVCFPESCLLARLPSQQMYLKAMLVWCTDEIGRLSELSHQVKALMSGTDELAAGVHQCCYRWKAEMLSSGMPLPKSMVPFHKVSEPARAEAQTPCSGSKADISHTPDITATQSDLT